MTWHCKTENNYRFTFRTHQYNYAMAISGALDAGEALKDGHVNLLIKVTFVSNGGLCPHLLHVLQDYYVGVLGLEY